MKYLTLVRHASAVHDSSYRDIERPLREKGLGKVKFIAEQCNERGYRPDLLVSSPAARAFETAALYAEESGCGITRDSILLDENLYMPSPGDILDCARGLDNAFSDVFIFSHNNGISWAAQEFCGDRSILMPTGSVVRIQFNIDLWRDVIFGQGRKVDFLP